AIRSPCETDERLNLLRLGFDSRTFHPANPCVHRSEELLNRLNRPRIVSLPRASEITLLHLQDAFFGGDALILPDGAPALGPLCRFARFKEVELNIGPDVGGRDEVQLIGVLPFVEVNNLADAVLVAIGFDQYQVRREQDAV